MSNIMQTAQMVKKMLLPTRRFVASKLWFYVEKVTRVMKIYTEFGVVESEKQL